MGDTIDDWYAWLFDNELIKPYDSAQPLKLLKK